MPRSRREAGELDGAGGDAYAREDTEALMTVGELLMELLRATTEGGVPESARVVLIVPRSNEGNLEGVVVGPACVLLQGSA
jgi:hypothetical protein